MKIKCDICRSIDISKGRAFDGRRAYRCNFCGHYWTNGLQGRKQKFSSQRLSWQFADSKGPGHTR